MGDGLGDRMKANYENRGKSYLLRRTPVIIRVDGRAFHTYTRQFERPFDETLQSAMAHTAMKLCNEAQGAKLAYVQSDEISVLLTDWDNLQTESWFGYNQAKINSISASIATLEFNKFMRHVGKPNGAMFDARCFNIPREEISNYFLWRARDWYRNSVTMYAGSFFSHKQMHKKTCADLHEMMHQQGKNWTTDLTPMTRNGTFMCREDGRWFDDYDILPQYVPINDLVQRVLPHEEPVT